MQIDYSQTKKWIINRRFIGCPLCSSSRYIVFTDEIPDKTYHRNELYCHSCDILFSTIHAVPPLEVFN